MIKVGDTLPQCTLQEYSEVEGEGCSIGPNPVDVAKATAGKTIALFALPGGFTPRCSAKHVPGYVENFEALIAAGYPSDYNGEAYATVSGQNANNSVRVTNDFIQAVHQAARLQFPKPGPTRRMGEQMQDRRLGAGRAAGFRNDLGDLGRERELAHLDRAQHQNVGEGLRHREDAEHGILRER